MPMKVDTQPEFSNKNAINIGYLYELKGFRRKLCFMIKNPPDGVRMKVTPDMARIMMEYNESDEWKNRPQSKTGVSRFARAMSEGRWVYTGEAIVFSSTGKLLNGQHRLMACVTSGVTIEILVVFGVADDAFKYMDVGVKRTAGHIFAIENIPNYNFAASALRVVFSYINHPTWGGSLGRAANVDNDELLAFYYLHPSIIKSYKPAQRMHKENLMAPRWAGALHYICATQNREQADEFFYKVATGIGLEDATPEYAIRKRLEAAARFRNDQHSDDATLAACLIKAWNAYRNGRAMKIIRWRGGQNPTELFPRAV